ncbi:MAG: response regulator receiver [Hyphomonadaceae bacterium]|nr:MAG: response regulator receiver [Hyphomonadaceae bacterium]
MANRDLGEALAVIYDPIRGNMLTTRGVLHGMGFRRIDGITSITQLERRIKENDIAVLFLEASEDTKKVSDLLQTIRMGEIKANPFLPIIATLWAGNGESVAGLMNAGADDVLLRPFSVVRAQERIGALIDNRRGFVVTSDYVGPDRGKRSDDRLNVEAFTVPNALRAVVTGEISDPVMQSEILENAKKRMNKERLAKLARRIAMAAEVTIQADADASDSKGFVVDLLETSAELVRTSRAIFVTYATDEGEVFKKELDEVMATVRSRLTKAKIREANMKKLVTKNAKIKQSEIQGFLNPQSDDFEGMVLNNPVRNFA